ATDTWNGAMRAVHQKIFDRIDAGEEAKKYFASASGIYTKEFCVYSGQLATDACKADPRGGAIKKGYFTADDIPVDDCDKHVMVKVCKDTNCIATDTCPDTKEVSFIDHEREDPPEEVELTVRDSQYILDRENVCEKHKSAEPDDDNKDEGDDKSDEDKDKDSGDSE
ncbi:MAG: hypothetical protein IJ519_02445, partial [Clostridia bacterium]|nr:hypothetical protein [Clostridia bacterium]